MRWSPATLLCLLALPGAAKAFNENGYRSGMTLDEVRRTVALRGTRLDLPTGPDEKGSQGFTEVSGPPGNLVFFGSFAFCQGKLFFYSQMFNDAEFATFARLAERRNLELGTGSYFVSSSETRVGPIYNFRLEWQGRGWTEHLDIGQVGRQTVNVSRAFWDNTLGCR